MLVYLAYVQFRGRDRARTCAFPVLNFRRNKAGTTLRVLGSAHTSYCSTLPDAVFCSLEKVWIGKKRAATRWWIHQRYYARERFVSMRLYRPRAQRESQTTCDGCFVRAEQRTECAQHPLSRWAHARADQSYVDWAQERDTE